MTQPQQYAQQPAPGSDPWQQAAQQYGGQPAQFQQGQAAYAGQYQAPAQPAQQGNLADAYVPESAKSQLFDGRVRRLSLFNKLHTLGSERSGIITAAPEDKQDKDNETQALKYWPTTRVDGSAKPVFDPIDRATGQPNRPVMSTHVEVDTDYRVTRDEWGVIGRSMDDFREGEDDGARVFVASGDSLNAMKKAMQAANRNGIKIAGPEDLIGLRLTAKRAGQKPNRVGQPSWVWEITLSRP